MRKHNRFVTAMLTGTALLGVLSASAGAVRAVPSTHKLYVNNQLADVAAYNIEGNNYFKLRDIAKLVGFGVAYDPQVNSVALTSNQPYEDDGSGGGGKTSVQATDNAKLSPQTIYVDGAQQSPTVYNINGNNYFKLRDLGEMIDFSVGFTAATSRVDINTEKPYAAEQTPPATDNTEQGTQGATKPTDTMKEVSNNPGYFYDTSLLIVPPEVEGLPLSELKQKLPDLEQRLRNWELAMVDLVNEERRNAGLNGLVIDEDTMGRARYWAKNMADTGKFKHATVDDGREYAVTVGLSNLEPAQINGVDDSTDKKVFDKVVGVGENIAGTPLIDNPVERMMKALMNSPGHKAAILDADAKTIGTGLAVSEKGAIYCCQNFGMVIYED